MDAPDQCSITETAKGGSGGVWISMHTKLFHGVFHDLRSGGRGADGAIHTFILRSNLLAPAPAPARIL